MPIITFPEARKIIDDFTEEIKLRKTTPKPPKIAVIDFRNEIMKGFERPIELVQIELLRYRKDNGRISSDLINYEKIHGILDETEDETQTIIRNFLEDKDKENTEDLMKSIFHKGQIEPAIITCDGFLINGNRRKVAMEKLLQSSHGNEKFKWMRVVILPGKEDEGGPPTLLEIEQIENRYQLQRDARAEYYGFDRALSIRRKIQIGMTLEEQLRDDPRYTNLKDSDFKKEVERVKAEYLKPLECVDRYLESLGRPELYSTVSRSAGDSEGRWQAFLDYYNSVFLKIDDLKRMMKLGLDEEDKGKVEDIAFKIIRKRHLKDLPKVHIIMRDLTKFISNEESRKELFKLIKIDNNIPEEDRYEEKGKELDEREIDKIWSKKNEQEITWHVKKAIDYFKKGIETETPTKLLLAALEKLNHDNMIPSSVPIPQIETALKICNLIKDRIIELKTEFYRYEKEYKEFVRKK